MEVVIKGSAKAITLLLKVNSLFMKRRGLSVVSDEPKQEEPKQEKPLKLPETIELINSCETIEDLEKYSKDERKGAKMAFEAKKEELEG